MQMILLADGDVAVGGYLDTRGRAYLKNPKLCLDKFSRKTVHDLHTPIRRLLVSLDVVRPAACL